jgi:hypothetical protein
MWRYKDSHYFGGSVPTVPFLKECCTRMFGEREKTFFFPIVFSFKVFLAEVVKQIR